MDQIPTGIHEVRGLFSGIKKKAAGIAPCIGNVVFADKSDYARRIIF